jgi:hypothetical protein
MITMDGYEISLIRSSSGAGQHPLSVRPIDRVIKRLDRKHTGLLKT